MQTVLVCTELLVVLSITPLVSGQCSTCLRGRCYDTGQCVLGCVAGYVYEYCDKACPSNCLNRLCHVDIQLNTVSCTDGCKPGFCGVKCSYPCPDGCVTCDRQCGSCNVTVCTERRYGGNCSKICSPEYGTCDRESGKCINCIRGYYGDHCQFPCTECFSGPRNIAYKCWSGCDVCRNQGPCPEGLFGDKCERRCSLNCGLSDNTAERLCNRATGECSTGCVSGYHGLACNYTCNKFCVGGVCYQTNGVCTSGCITGYRPNMDMCEQYNNGGTQRAVIIAVSVSVTFVCLVAGIVIAVVVILRRRRSRRNKKQLENDEVAEPLLKYEKGDVTFKSIQMAASDSRPGTVDSGTLKLKLEEADDIFVPTKAFDDVRQTLEEKCHVTICGASGEGKTTMALMLGQEYLTQGYELVFVDRPDVFDLGACISSGRKVCLIFDDIFGSDGRSIDVSNVEKLCDTLKLHIDRQTRKGDIDLKGLEQVRQNDDILIQESAKKPGRNMLGTDQVGNVRNDIDQAYINSQSKNVRAIFTSKTYNFNEGISKSKHIFMFHRRAMVDLTVNPGSSYSCQEKRSMLEKYKKRFSERYIGPLEEENVITQDLSLFGFPQTCRLFFESFSKETAKAIDFFRNPIDYLSLEFTNILNRKNEQAAALILVMMSEGELTLPDLESPNTNEKLDRMMVQIANFTNSVTWSGIAGATRRFRGTFLSRDGKLSFAHSSIYDAFAYTLYQFNPTFVLNYCSLDFLFERLRASPTDEKGVSDKKNYLVVEEEYFPLLIERFVSSIEKGGFSKTVAHPIMQNKLFVKMFLKKFDKHVSGQRTWFQHKEKEKGLLYWIVRSEGTHLVENIERVLKIRFTDNDIKEALFSCVECDCLTLFKLLMGKLEQKLDNSMLGKYLLASAKSSGEEMVKYLLKNEAKVSEIGRKRQNFLHLLCTFNSPGVLGMVKTHAMKEDLDSAIHAVDEQGNTPLMVAALNGTFDCFELIRSKIKTSVKDIDFLIHLACVGGNKHIVKSVLTPQNINTRGFHETTPIMMAAREGKSDIFDLLLSQGANVTLVDEDGDTLIHHTCIGGNKHIAERVLTPQNINTRGFNGRTPIMMAALGRKSDIIDLLLSQGADVTLVAENNNALIHHACIGGNKHIAERVLTPQNINTRGFHGRTPIMMAAYCGKSDIFDLLLTKEADVTLVDEDGNALIHHACDGGNKYIVESVLTTQNINTRGFHGRTPIMMAAREGKSDIFDLLLTKEADVTLVGEDGNALIHHACDGGNKHIVESVLTPQNINTRGFHGRTPIMMAASEGKSDIFDLLLTKDADVTLVDEDGNALIHHACDGGNKHIVESVLTPQNINTRGFHGRTPIMMAASEGKSDIFDLLLTKEADVTLVAKNKNALIHHACIGGNKHIVESVLTPQNINTRGFHERTPIMMAAFGGKSDIFDLLLTKEADVTLVGEDGNALIHHACDGGNKHIVERVLTPQNINTRGFHERTPIMMAAFGGKSDIFDLLLTKEADVTLVGEDGNALIHHACDGGNKHIVERVLTPQNINTRGFHERTPIMMAALGGKSDIFDLLLTKEADVTLVDEDGNTLIHHACIGGNKHIVESVLTPQNINTRGFNERTPIMRAASEGKSDIFDLLLSQGADVTLVDEDGDTLIHHACDGGNKHIVESVLTPQNINTRGFNETTPIMRAASEGKSDIFDLLLTKEADVTLVDEDGDTLIHHACDGGNKHIVESVLTPQNINTRGFHERTPIMMAALGGKSDIFDLLLTKEADVTLVDEDGNTLIHHACDGGNKHIVESVLTPQNINTRGFNGVTPIMISAYGGKSDIFDLLLTKEADVTLVDEDGDTLIHHACIGGNKHIVESVLTPQNINTRGFHVRTPIMISAYGGKSDIFDLLLTKEADVTLVDEDGDTLIHHACDGGNKHIVESVLTPQNINTRGFHVRTPIMMAAYGGKSDIFDLLLTKEADVTLVDEDGDTLIHHACIGGNKQIVESVLTPQNINTRNKKGMTPIMVAAHNGHINTVAYLCEKGAHLTCVDTDGRDVVAVAGKKGVVEYLEKLIVK